MSIGSLFLIAISAIFINNFVLSRFLGLCPFMGVSKKLDSAFGMGGAVIFVMTIASAVTWVIQNYVLNPDALLVKADLRYLQTIAFIVVIASLVQFIEMFLHKSLPHLYKALGIFLPLITTNCAILGVTILNIKEGYNFLETVINGFSAGLGFLLALVMMAGIREKLELADVPEYLKGVPITFITASLMSLAFMGFSGMLA